VSAKPKIADLPALQLATGLGINLSFNDADKLMKALQEAYRTGYRDGVSSQAEGPLVFKAEKPQ
jgi:hypothetical protein